MNVSVFVLGALGLWPQRMELCGSGSFLKSVALQDFLLQIRTLTSLICLSLGASFWRDTEFTCRVGLLLSLNSILQTLEISARRGERVIVSGEKNCVGSSCLKKRGLEWYLVKYGCQAEKKSLLESFSKSFVLMCFVLCYSWEKCLKCYNLYKNVLTCFSCRSRFS